MNKSSKLSQKWWAMLGVGLGVLMFTIDTSVVNIALPTLVRDFKTSFSMIQWVVLSYLIVINALVLGAARLGDMFGKKKLYQAGVVLFVLGSLLCGFSPQVGWLIGFRALQGVGGVMLSALSAAIVTEVFPRSERGRALGIIGAVVSTGITLGPTIGGLLISWFNWRAIFWINVPIGVFAYFVVAHSVPGTRLSSRERRFDWLGSTIVTVVLVCFALGMTEGQSQGFDSIITLVLLAIASLGLFGFIWVERRSQYPVLDLSLFDNLQFSLALMAGFLIFGIIAGWVFLAPFFLELVLQYPTRVVGLLMAVPPVLGGIVAPCSGYLSDRYGSRSITLVGTILIALSCLAISTFKAQMTEWEVILRIAPLGIGIGMFQSPNNSAILGEVPPERVGIASGLLSLSRTLAQSAGLPLMATIFTMLTLAHTSATNVTNASPDAIVAGFQGTFKAAALVSLAIVILAAVLWRMERQGMRG